MKTNISWTDESSNPIRFRRLDNGKMGWQCVKVSDGCKNCYAEKMNLSPRFSYGTDLAYTIQNMKMVEPILIEKELHRLETSKILSGKKVFIEDMSDFLGDFIPQELRQRVMDVLEKRKDVIFQILTKRPENAFLFLRDWFFGNWPEHIWFGTSIENNNHVDRIIATLNVPAKIHFFSVEPMLTKIDMHFSDFPNQNRDTWVICGGESGIGCRLFDWDWARDLRDQCKKSNVAFWMKQGGGYPNSRHKLEDIPEDLRIREFPEFSNTFENL